MIPSQTLEEFEPFAESGDKVAPVPAKYAQGYLPGEVFPAQHENFLMGKASRCSEQHRAGLRSVEAELNNVVDAGGAEPDDEDDTQVLTAIQYLIDQAIAAEREKEMPIGFIWTTRTAPNAAGGNPNTLFPGTYWKRLKDCVIRAAGDADTVDDTVRGQDTVTIGSANLPKHTHTLSSHTHGAGTLDTTYKDLSHTHTLSIDGDFGTAYWGEGIAQNQRYARARSYTTGGASISMNHKHTITGSTGGPSSNDTGDGGFSNTALNIQNKYLARYCWERITQAEYIQLNA